MIPSPDAHAQFKAREGSRLLDGIGDLARADFESVEGNTRLIGVSVHPGRKRLHRPQPTGAFAARFGQ